MKFFINCIASGDFVAFTLQLQRMTGHKLPVLRDINPASLERPFHFFKVFGNVSPHAASRVGETFSKHGEFELAIVIFCVFVINNLVDAVPYFRGIDNLSLYKDFLQKQP